MRAALRRHVRACDGIATGRLTGDRPAVLSDPRGAAYISLNFNRVNKLADPFFVLD